MATGGAVDIDTPVVDGEGDQQTYVRTQEVDRIQERLRLSADHLTHTRDKGRRRRARLRDADGQLDMPTGFTRQRLDDELGRIADLTYHRAEELRRLRRSIHEKLMETGPDAIDPRAAQMEELESRLQLMTATQDKLTSVRRRVRATRPQQGLPTKGGCDLGPTKGDDHGLATPSKLTPQGKESLYRLVEALRRATVTEREETLLQQGHILPLVNPWDTPVVGMRKKGRIIRLCVDYRLLNWNHTGSPVKHRLRGKTSST